MTDSYFPRHASMPVDHPAPAPSSGALVPHDRPPESPSEKAPDACCGCGSCQQDRLMEAAIRNAALEEAAEVASRIAREGVRLGADGVTAAPAIRALKTPPAAAPVIGGGE